MTDIEVRGASAKSPREVPEGAVTAPLRNVLSPEAFVPRLLAILSNALVRRESRELRALVGLGTNDWRVISALGARPGMPASEVSEFLVVNKAVVSKSVGTLGERGLIVMGDGPRGSRPLFLTEQGAHMHDVMKPISESGEQIILEGMTDDEIAALTAVLQRMLERIGEAD